MTQFDEDTYARPAAAAAWPLDSSWLVAGSTGSGKSTAVWLLTLADAVAGLDDVDEALDAGDDARQLRSVAMDLLHRAAIEAAEHGATSVDGAR